MHGHGNGIKPLWNPEGNHSRIEELLLQLSDRLFRTTGKKVYGYLKADVKAIVDQIVAELAGDENIRKLYDLSATFHSACPHENPGSECSLL